MKIIKTNIFIAAFLTLVALTVQTSLADGLVADYPFNGNANDASGNNLNGSITNATFDFDRFGVANSSIQFTNQTTSCVAITNFASVTLSNQMTISLWAKFNQSWGFHVESLFWRGLYPNTTIEIAVNQDSSQYGSGNYAPLFTVTTIDSYAVQITGTNFMQFSSLTNWNQFVGVFSNGLMSLYFDGIKVGNATATGSIISDASALIIGGSSHPVSGAYDRNVDDVQIYNQAFSDFQVQQLYQNQITPLVNLVKAVTVSFSNLTVGTNYQLQVSSDLNSWTNVATPFTATNSTMIYSNYWNVSDWNQLFFRLH